MSSPEEQAEIASKAASTHTHTLADISDAGTAAAVDLSGNANEYMKGDGTFGAPSGSGDVSGPASATDNALARFDGTTGKLLQNSGITIGDNGEMILAAGGAADAPLKLQAGANLTTAEDGAVEYDGTCIYMTTDDGNRGVNLIEHFIRLPSNYTLTSSTSEQKLFNSPTNGRLTLETGTYFFECLVSISSLSATSGNAAFDILGAGTAALANVLYHAVGADGNTATTAAQTGSTAIQGQSPASMVTAGTGTTMSASIRGTFEVTGAGTIVPSVTLVTAAAGVVRAGSYFRCRRVGATGVASVGQWD